MGARHLVVVDGELAAVGVITRADMNEHRLAHFWHEEVGIIILVLKKFQFLPFVSYVFSTFFAIQTFILDRENKCRRT
jgi:hypothetical protein